MEKEDHRKEYVLEDFGYIWKGFLREVPWTFGQVTSKMDDTRPYPLPAETGNSHNINLLQLKPFFWLILIAMLGLQVIRSIHIQVLENENGICDSNFSECKVSIIVSCSYVMKYRVNVPSFSVAGTPNSRAQVFKLMQMAYIEFHQHSLKIL